MAHVRILVRAGIAALALGSGLIAVLHVVGPGAAISPIRRTISEYGLTDVAWVFDLAVLTIAAGSVAILAATALAGHRHPPRRSQGIGLLLGGLWVLGLVTVVAFPKANWAIGPSVSGQIHRAASLIAFIALPIAVLVLLRGTVVRGRRGPGLARAGRVLALAALAWFVPIVVAIASGAHGGAWWLAVPLGLLERGMAVTEIAALVVLGTCAERSVRRSGRVPVTARGRVTTGVSVTDPTGP